MTFDIKTTENGKFIKKVLCNYIYREICIKVYILVFIDKKIIHLFFQFNYWNRLLFALVFYDGTKSKLDTKHIYMPITWFCDNYETMVDIGNYYENSKEKEDYYENPKEKEEVIIMKIQKRKKTIIKIKKRKKTRWLFGFLKIDYNLDGVSTHIHTCTHKKKRKILKS